MIEGKRTALRGCGKWLAVSVAATALSCVLAPAAHAGMSNFVAAGVELVGGDDGETDPGFKFSGPGKLTISTYDVGMVGTIAPPLAGLSFSVYSSGSIFGTHSGVGEMTMDITGPGMYFLNLAAIPSLQSRFGLGMVSWTASFEPDASTVPLPASVWLLLAGLAWATGMQRKRATLVREDRDSMSWGSPAAVTHALAH